MNMKHGFTQNEGFRKITLAFLFLCIVSQELFAQPPLVYSVENTGANCAPPALPSISQLPVIMPLPDPFAWANGNGRSTNFNDWECRRNEIKAQIEAYEIGMKPPKPDDITASYVPSSTTAGILTVVVKRNGQTLMLTSQISLPAVPGPWPAIIGMNSSSGSVPATVFTSRNIARITYNHNNVTTYGNPQLTDPFYRLYPEYNLVNAGQYSAWAWGVSRIIDGLALVQATLPINLQRIGVTGCSYAGKMALFSGALDERIALTIAQESGGGGAPAWRVSHNLEPNGTVEKIDNTDYRWFRDSMAQFAGDNVYKLPHDHHELMAMVAPRALLVTGNTDFTWLSNKANYVSSRATKEIYKTLGISDRFGFYIDGGHNHCAVPTSQVPAMQAFVDKFLADVPNVITDTVTVNPFPAIDYQRWYQWWGTGNPVLPPPPGRSVWLEAECATVGADWNTVADTAASNGKYVAVKNGLTSTATPPVGDAAYLVIPFTVDSAANYNFLARLNNSGGDDYSYWMKLDNGAFQSMSSVLLANGGFENGLTGWTTLNANGATLTATTAAADVRTGTGALKVVNPTAQPGNQWRVQLSSAVFPTTIGKQYVISYWVKAASPGGSIRLSTGPTSAQYQADQTIGTSWQQVSWTITASLSSTTFLFDMGQVANTYYIDDASVKEVGAGSGWQWIKLRDADLTAGSHTLTFGYREGSVQLDKLLITTFSTAVAGKGETATNCALAASPVYYSKPTGDLHNVLTWGLNSDGSGANPTDFNDSTFQLANRSSGLYTMTGNWAVAGIINIAAGSQLQINGNTLSVNDLAGMGTISGSATSNLAVMGSASGNVMMNFTDGSNMLNNLTVNRSGAGATVSLGNALSVMNVLTLTNGALNTGGFLTLKSTAATTARVAPITFGTINGEVTVERYIPARRAWRILSAPVGGISGGATGQASLTHSQEPGATPLMTFTGTARPLSYGTASFSLNAARTAMTMTATIYNIDVTGLQTPDINDNLVNAHIHVGAAPGSNAAVRWGFIGSPDNDVNPKQLVVTPFASGVGGTFTSTWDSLEGATGTTLATNLPGILAGLSYINFHTTQFAGGEIRGQIMMAGTGTQTINQSWQEDAVLGSSANPNPFPGYGTHITGGPVYGSTANGFDQNPGAASSIMRYNSLTNGWEELPNTNATSVGTDAYMTFIRGDRSIALSNNAVPPNATTLRAKGPLKTGDQVFQVSGSGFTAIPNPFASPINFATLTRTGVQNNFYVWDPKLGSTGAYVLLSDNGMGGYTITPAPASPESQYIQSGQGFLVRPATLGTAGSLTIKESDKSATAATDVFRTTGNGNKAGLPKFVDPGSGQGLRVTLKEVSADASTIVLDEVLSSYYATYNKKLDALDAVKMPNLQENLGILSEGQVLMVERKPLPLEADVIALKLWNATPKSYVLEVNPVNLSSIGLIALIEDQYLKTSTPVALDRKSDIAFTVTGNPASARADRFRIVFAKKLPDALTLSKGITAYPTILESTSLNLSFVNQDKGVYTIRLISSLGQTIFNKTVQHAGGTAVQKLQLDTKPVRGVYQLQIAGKYETIHLSIVSQ